MRTSIPSVNPFLRPRHRQTSFRYSAHLAMPSSRQPISCLSARSRAYSVSAYLAPRRLQKAYERNKLPPRRPRTLKQQSGQPDVQMASCTQTVIFPPRRPRTLKPQSGQPHVQMASCTQTVVFHQFSCPTVCSEPNPTKTTLPPKQNNAPKWTP